MLTDSDLKMLEDICHQSSVGVWRDFPAKGRGYRTHIGYPMLREDDGEMVNIPILETNTNAKRGDVLFVVYAHEYMLKLIEDAKDLRHRNLDLSGDVGKLSAITVVALDLLKRLVEKSREPSEGDCVYCNCELGGGNDDDCYDDCIMVEVRKLLVAAEQRCAADLPSCASLAKLLTGSVLVGGRSADTGTVGRHPFCQENNERRNRPSKNSGSTIDPD